MCIRVYRAVGMPTARKACVGNQGWFWLSGESMGRGAPRAVDCTYAYTLHVRCIETEPMPWVRVGGAAATE